ncbi:hypothetical protein ACO0LG_08825 [Undibacterium sp. Ji42W]
MKTKNIEHCLSKPGTISYRLVCHNRHAHAGGHPWLIHRKD